MKSPEEIQAARKIVCDRFASNELSGPQKILLCGMLQSLVWACDGAHDSTMRDVLAGRPIDASPDPASFLIGNLAMLVRRMAHALPEGLALRKQAEDYLRRAGLAGSPVRNGTKEERDA